jgi:hypothetical protein
MEMVVGRGENVGWVLILCPQIHSKQRWCGLASKLQLIAFNTIETAEAYPAGRAAFSEE